MPATKTQHMAALERATTVRLKTADYLRSIRSGEIALAEAVRDCDLPTRLDKLIDAKHRVRRTRLRSLCAQAGLRLDPAYYIVSGDYGTRSGFRPLTDREREALAARFERAGL